MPQSTRDEVLPGVADPNKDAESHCLYPDIRVSLFVEGKNKEIWNEILEVVSSESVKKIESKKKDKKMKQKAKNEKIKSVFYLNKNVEVNDHDIDSYVECGMKIDLSFAIDFTISNGNHQRGEPSLHQLDQSYKNIYTEIIQAIGTKLGRM